MRGSVGDSSFQGGHVAQGHSARGISRPPCVPLGRGMLERGARMWGMRRGGKDGEEVAQTEWLQSGSLLVLRWGEGKGFLGPKLQNLVT